MKMLYVVEQVPYLGPHTVSSFLHKVSSLGCIIRFAWIKFRRRHMVENVIVRLCIILLHDYNVAVPFSNLVIEIGLARWQ